MKHRRLLLVPFVLVFAMLACNLTPGGAAKPAPTDTQPAAHQTEPTQPPLVPTEPLPLPTDGITRIAPTAISATEAPLPTEAQPAPTTAVIAPTSSVPAQAGPIVLAKIGTDHTQPAVLRLVDPTTGMTQGSFQAVGLSQGPAPLVGGSSIFFTDFSSSGVHRVGLDGVAQDLSFMTPENKIFDGMFLPSPDGSRIAWSKVVSQDANNLHIQLLVANMDGSNQKVILDDTRSVPSRPEPLRWSNDGKSIFFTNVPYGIGGYILFFGGPDLLKIDVETGKITQNLLTSGCLCAMVVSPDETKVAYIQRPEGDQLNMMLKDLSGGNPVKANLPANHFQAGAIVWSPDSQSFLVTVAKGEPDNEAYSVVLVHASDLSMKVLIPDDPRLLQAAVWPTAGIVWLNDKDNNAWRMDPTTGTLTQSSTGERVLAAYRQ
jgi:hypothetical protein